MGPFESRLNQVEWDDEHGQALADLISQACPTGALLMGMCEAFTISEFGMHASLVALRRLAPVRSVNVGLAIIRTYIEAERRGARERNTAERRAEWATRKQA